MYDETKLSNVGFRIRFFRMEKSISQSELAQQIGISQTHLSNIERSHVNINLKLLLSIANTVGCTLETLVDTRSALDWRQEQAENGVPKQEAYTLEEVRQLLQLLRLSKQ